MSDENRKHVMDMIAGLDRLKPLAQAPRRVLVVDDEAEICNVIRDMAGTVGVSTSTAHNTSEAMALLERESFGLLVVDLRLPGDHGLKLLGFVRQQPRHRACPALIISGHYGHADLIKVQASIRNCLAFCKPLEMADFLAVLGTVLPAPAPSSADEAPALPANLRLVGNRDLAFRLEVDTNEQVARLVACPASESSLNSQAALTAALRAAGVCSGIDPAAIGQAFQRAERDLAMGETIVIARGSPAVPGRAGEIRLAVDVTGRASYDAADAGQDAVVDYRTATHVTVVQPGDLLAEVLPPTEGTPGVDLAGKPIPAKAGKRVLVTAGDGVRADETSGEFFATVHGRPTLLGGTLRVDPVYEVRGDVDFSTGNIDFQGHVVVRGGVKDDFRVTCNSAEIHGTVGAAAIETSGDLQIWGGVSGHERATIRARGSAQIKYVNQAEVTVFGDLTVDREIVNARTWCQGKVRAGQILGGECLALLGVEARILGSELGVPTTVEAGTNFEVRQIDLALERVEGGIDQVLKPVQALLGDRAAFLRLPAGTQATHREGFVRFQALKKQHDSLSADRNMLLSLQTYQPVKEVVVRKELFQDVSVQTEHCRRLFKTSLRGPLRLVEDMARGEMRPVEVAGKGASAGAASGDDLAEISHGS